MAILTPWQEAQVAFDYGFLADLRAGASTDETIASVTQRWIESDDPRFALLKPEERRVLLQHWTTLLRGKKDNIYPLYDTLFGCEP